VKLGLSFKGRSTDSASEYFKSKRDEVEDRKILKKGAS
jgi:hypothetical protein